MAPMAPRHRSSHMNQNRRWPGVPKRYRTRSSASVMRPKSMATVVVALVGTASRSSTPSDSLVTRASVRSGLISDTEPTKVVLPTPKPPATTIFVDAVARPPALERAKSTEGPFDQIQSLVTRRAVVQGGLYPHVTLFHEVPQQDADDADRHLHRRRDLRDRLAVADLDDATLQVAPPLLLVRRRLQHQGGLHGEVDGALGAPGGDRVGADDPRGRLLVGVPTPRVRFSQGHGISPQTPVRLRAWAWIIRPTRSTSRAIS